MYKPNIEFSDVTDAFNYANSFDSKTSKAIKKSIYYVYLLQNAYYYQCLLEDFIPNLDGKRFDHKNTGRAICKHLNAKGESFTYVSSKYGWELLNDDFSISERDNDLMLYDRHNILHNYNESYEKIFSGDSYRPIINSDDLKAMHETSSKSEKINLTPEEIVHIASKYREKAQEYNKALQDFENKANELYKEFTAIGFYDSNFVTYNPRSILF